MAERVDRLPWNRGRGPAPKYPYDEWFDGSIWLLKPGEDFTCKVTSLQTRLRSEASRRGHRLTFLSRDEGVYIRIAPLSTEQKP